MRINLSRVTNDARLQRRAKGLDKEHVKSMMQRLLDDPTYDLPPVSAVSEGNDFHFWDGWHRIEAYRQAKRKDIPATVTTGTWRDAYTQSFTANSEQHGLPRTKADTDKLLKDAFADDEFKKLSDHELARMTGLHQTTVSRHRKKLSNATALDAPATRTATRNGTTYPIDTTNIGRATAPVEPAMPETPALSINGTHEANGKHEGNGKAEAPEPLTDTVGTPIPERVAEAFTTAKAIATLCQDIDAILKRAEAIAKSFGGRLIRMESVRQQLKDAKGNLWANRATHVCPYCHGEEQAPCEVCKGQGWTAKHIYEQSPGNNKRAKRA